MKIPADHIGKLTSPREASAYKKALELQNSVENVAANLERADDGYDDLSNKEAGHVTVDNFSMGLSLVTGDYRFDPSTHQPKSLDAKVDGIDGFLNTTTRYRLSNDDDQLTYSTSSGPVTNRLLIDKHSGDWNISSSFLGIPTG